MATYLPVPGTIPAGFCPASWQAVLNQFAALLPIIINGDDEVIIQVDEPGQDDRSKLWVKMLDVAPWVDSIRVWVPEIPPSGDWRPIPGQPVYFVDTGAVNTMTITTGESMNSELFLTGRLFCIKANNANTGAVTLAVDSVSSKSVKKLNSLDLEAGDFVAGQIILLAFDPVSNVFELLSTLPPPTIVIPAGTPETSVNMTPIEDDVPDQVGTAYAHGLPGRPSFVRATILLGSGFEVEASSVVYRDIPSGAVYGPALGIHSSSTFINVYRTVIAAGVNKGFFYPDSNVGVNNMVQVDLNLVKLRLYAKYDIPRAPSVSTQPTSATRSPGQNVTFTVVAIGDTPITYQWQRNGVNIFDGGRLSGTATASLTITGVVDGVPPGGDEANYSCVLTNGTGSVSSNTASLTVT